MRSKAARFAMAGGNVNNPTARFVEIAQQNSRSLDRSVEGYTSNDMGNYLQWLKHVKLIRGYKWKACREGMLENVLLRPTKFQSPNTACIFFGATTPTDCRDVMKKKLGWFERSTKKENWGEKRRSKELIQYYEGNLAKSMKQRSQSCDLAHGVAVGVDEGESIWLYDNGKKNWKRLYSIKDFAECMLSYWRSYVLEIDVGREEPSD